MKNCTIEIQNVGPIKNVNIDLNKINVFMGAQSSGKSTIAKIISFCAWVEKDVSINQSFKEYNLNTKYFIERLETFHKMKGYFNTKSKILFTSETIKIEYIEENFNIEWNNRYAYRRSKISYIPAERSITILPEIEKVEFPNNYIKSFLFDWLDARKNYSTDAKLTLLDINAQYYFSESSKESHISNNDKTYDILLSQASSGLQSITPLLVMIDHLTKYIYSNDQNMSYVFDEIKIKVSQILLNQLVFEPLYGKTDLNKTEIDKFVQSINSNDATANKYFNEFKLIRNNLFNTNSTNIILEEPEQNLFPSTQKSLIYYLLNAIGDNDDHSLTITTHSPYILYAINNCIMAHLTHDKISLQNSQNLCCEKSKIQSELISIYEIKDGYIDKIQQEDGLIGDNFFDQKMKEVMDEFYLMLNHY